MEIWASVQIHVNFSRLGTCHVETLLISDFTLTVWEFKSVVRTQNPQGTTYDEGLGGGWWYERGGLVNGSRENDSQIEFSVRRWMQFSFLAFLWGCRGRTLSGVMAVSHDITQSENILTAPWNFISFFTSRFQRRHSNTSIRLRHFGGDFKYTIIRV